MAVEVEAGVSTFSAQVHQDLAAVIALVAHALVPGMP